MLSRRHLLAAAGAVPVAAVLGARPAVARPIVLADIRVRRWGPVAVIGDSQAGGYVSGLERRLVAKGVGPFRCDIQGSRSIDRESDRFPSGISAVRSARAAGFDPSAWVVALGANDMWFISRRPRIAEDLIDGILAEIGRERSVVFPTVWVPDDTPRKRFNSALWTATTRWPRLQVLDWAGLAAQHPEWSGSDGAHYTPAGADVRNAFLAKAAVRGVKAARQDVVVHRRPTQALVN